MSHTLVNKYLRLDAVRMNVKLAVPCAHDLHHKLGQVKDPTQGKRPPRALASSQIRLKKQHSQLNMVPM